MHSEASDQPNQPVTGPGTESVTVSRSGAPGTGVPEVDEVLASLEGLEESPPAEHVAVFERAHDRLRRALDTDPGEFTAATPEAQTDTEGEDG